MPKIKIPKKSPRVDMTPMVDLFSLLLTFFMLTATFRPQEVAEIDTPASTSDYIKADTNMILISVDANGRVFYDFDNGTDTSKHFRYNVLKDVGASMNIKFTPEELKRFEKMNTFGLPIARMKAWLAAKEQNEKSAMQTGIPCDSVDNQLAKWVSLTRRRNARANVCIKGDSKATYETMKKVFDVLLDNKVNRFSLITNLESVEVKLKD